MFVFIVVSFLRSLVAPGGEIAIRSQSSVRYGCRGTVYAMDVAEQLWRPKLGLLTPHKVTADYLIVGQNKYPLGNLIRRRKFRTFLEFAFFRFVARSLTQLSQLL